MFGRYGHEDGDGDTREPLSALSRTRRGACAGRRDACLWGTVACRCFVLHYSTGTCSVPILVLPHVAPYHSVDPTLSHTNTDVHSSPLFSSSRRHSLILRTSPPTRRSARSSTLAHRSSAAVSSRLSSIRHHPPRPSPPHLSCLDIRQQSHTRPSHRSPPSR